MHAAILTRPGNRSPLILARSLKKQLENEGMSVVLSDRIAFLKRMVSYKDSGLSFHFWLRNKIAHYFADRKILKELRKADVIIISECIPNAFRKRLYNVERLKAVSGKPVLLYEVYYLENAPTQVELLQQGDDPLQERFDAHLFVAPVTELRKRAANAFCIGILANQWNLKPLPKKELIAIVDFAQPGYENYREIQIRALEKAGIRFISLERQYSIDEIRDIYRDAAIFFVQFHEAFGLPILECLCTGTQIFTPDTGWPMSWRLDENPQRHGQGILPGCFTSYDGEDDLQRKLMDFKQHFQPEETPRKVFDTFISHYPSFYHGDTAVLQQGIKYVQNKISVQEKTGQ
ncbi:MAG: hypothetical protein QM791_02650 [Ferruginibacter sp.]